MGGVEELNRTAATVVVGSGRGRHADGMQRLTQASAPPEGLMAGSLRRRSLRPVSLHVSPVVIGAGMSGIAAACHLADQGLRPILLESRPDLGGRTRSFRHEGSGDEIDNGQHLMMGCYHSTFRLLNMLGTRDLVTIQRPLQVEFRDADGTIDRLSAPSFLPSPLALAVGMARLQRLTAAERRAAIRLGLSARFSPPRSDETVHQWLSRHRQSQRLQDRLWAPMAIATLNAYPDQASATLFAEVLRRGFLAWGDDARLAIPRCGLSRLIEPSRRFIHDRGGRVGTRCPVSSVQRGSDGLYIVRLRSGEEVVATDVISALPARNAASVLASWFQGEDVRYGITDTSPIVSLYLWYDHDPEDLPMFTALLGTRVQWVFNRRRIDQSDQRGRHAGLVSCTISAAFADAVDDATMLIAVADAELRQAIPSLAQARLMDALAIKEKHATFHATPENERLRPLAEGLRGERIILAGDWTATGLPATIEGGVASGFRAAEILVRNISAG